MSLLDIDIKDDYLEVLKSTIIQYLKKYGTFGIPLWHLENEYELKIHNLHKYDLSYEYLYKYILRMVINNKHKILNIYITPTNKFKASDKTILIWNRKNGADSVLTLKDLVDTCI